MLVRSKALAYLAEIQEGIPSPKRQREDRLARQLLDHGLTPPPDADQDLVRMVAGSMDHFRADYRDLRDRIPENQSISDYSIMAELKRVFDRSIAQKFTGPERYRRSDKVEFGTLETNDLNGWVMPVPGGDEYLIILNRSLWESFQVLSILIASSLDFKAYLPSPRMDPERATGQTPQFTALLEGVLLHKDLPFFFDNEEKNSFTILMQNYLHTAMDAFLFGHEYAHLLHGHFDRDSPLAFAAVGDRRLAHYRSDWSKEYEADRTGLDLTVFRFLEYHDERASRYQDAVTDAPPRSGASADSLRQYDRAVTIMQAIEGSVLFLHFVKLLERYRCTIYTADSTHPPTPLRIAAITSVISQQAAHPEMNRLIFERLHHLTGCLAFFAEHLTRPVVMSFRVDEFFESRLQAVVFDQIMHQTHADVLSGLYEVRDGLSAGASFAPEAIDHSSPFLTPWAEFLRMNAPPGDLPTRTFLPMFDRCIGVLERNADLWNIPRPTR